MFFTILSLIGFASNRWKRPKQSDRLAEYKDEEEDLKRTMVSNVSCEFRSQ